MALTMAHDVAKELGWMRRLLERLPDRVIDMTRLRRDVDILVDFTDGIAEQLRTIVVDSIAWSDEPSEHIGCEDVVRHAIERVSRIHHAASVVDSVDPAVRNLPCHENVSRVLVNLLDNAIRASGAGSPVHLYVTQRPSRLVFEVIDAGSGISELELDGAFGAGVTSRATEGGFGVGLGMCREMVEGLGGEIFLSSRLGQGTSATFWVPLTAATSAQESLHGPVA
jgi:signal transduction histidine kinase